MNTFSMRSRRTWRVVCLLVGVTGGLSGWGTRASLAEEPSIALSHIGVQRIAISPNGKTLASAGAAVSPARINDGDPTDRCRQAVKFWDLETREVRATIEFPRFRDEDVEKLVAAHPWVLEEIDDDQPARREPGAPPEDGASLLARVSRDPSRDIRKEAIAWWNRTVGDGNVYCQFHDLAYSPDGTTLAVAFEFQYPNPFCRHLPDGPERRDKKETRPSATETHRVPRRLWLGMYGLLDAGTGETLAVMGFDHNHYDMSKRVGLDPNNVFSGPLSFVKDGPFGDRCAYYAKNHPPADIHVRSGLSSLPRRGHWTMGNGIVPGRIGLSRDGSLVAGGGKIGIVEIWDRNGVVKATLDGHIHGVTFLAFLPDGWRDSYRTHDARKPRESSGEGLRLDGSHAPGAYRSDGPFELLTVDGHTTFRIWNTEGRLLGQWQTPEARKAVSYRIDPQGVLAGWDYDDQSWQHGYQCLDLSSDGRTIACRNFLERKPKGQAWLLDLATGERRSLKPRGAMKHVEPIDSAEFAPDGEKLVSAGEGKDGRIIVWAMPEGRPRKMFTPSDGSAQCRDLVLSRDGKKAAAVTGGNVRIWDISEFPIGR